MLEIHDERVAVRNEHFVHTLPERAPSELDVGERLFETPHPKRFRSVHVAIRAVVPRTPDRGLQDVGMRFARRPVELPFVTHREGGIVPRKTLLWRASLTSRRVNPSREGPHVD